MAANRAFIPSARPSRVHQVNAGPSAVSAPPVKPVQVEHPAPVLDFYSENHVQPGEPDVGVQPEPEPAPRSEVKAGPSIDSLFDDDEVEEQYTRFNYHLVLHQLQVPRNLMAPRTDVYPNNRVHI